MKKIKNIFLFISLLMFFSISSAFKSSAYSPDFWKGLEGTNDQTKIDSDIEIVRKRVVSDLLKGNVNQAKIESLMNSINKDGSWPDINYKDVSRTGFQNGEHLHRLVDLSRAYKKQGSKLKGNEKLKKVIYSALNYWLMNDFICDNWWWNQIGTPNALVKVLLIMDDGLTSQQITKTIPIVARATLKHVPGKFFGARESGDRVKIAGILAKRLLFERDSIQFDKVIDVIEEEIKFTTVRGMQYDYSFHHRDDKVNNTLSYGTQFANVLAGWAANVSGTKYRFSDSSMHLLVNYYLDGICKMLVYGKYPDPGAKNRAITRRGSLNAYSPIPPEELLKATNYRKDALEKIVEIREVNAKPTLSFSKFFWQSEHFTFQRPYFYTSVRMYSSRDDNMEKPYNGEGLMNHYRGDGTNYISRTGKEYDYLSPVYDWQKIPGTTIMQRSKMPPPKAIQQKGLTDFVGAVTDGKYGVVGFDFKSPLDPLEAKKAWFFFDDEYVCLGAGITGDSSLNVATTLNQCRLHGDVIVKNKDQRQILKKGLHQLSDIKWIWHDSIGYIFPKPTDVYLSNSTQTGSWYRVNHQESSSKKEVSENVFKLWISQGKHPQGASYQYIVAPAISKQEIKEVADNDQIKVLSNTPELQAVKNTHLHICEAVFYKPGSIRISDALQLTMSDPGIIMIKSKGDSISSISVEDPSHQLKKIEFTLSERIENKGSNFIFTSFWDKNDKKSHITIDLPQNVYRGKSVTIDF